MSNEEKELAEVYRQRGEAWMLAMAFAKIAGFEVGVRGNDGEWPVHVIMIPTHPSLPSAGGHEVALHMAMADTIPGVLKHETKREYDGHTNAQKEERIRAFVAKVFKPTQ